MMIFNSKMACDFLSLRRRNSLVIFFLCVYIFFPAQIYQTNNCIIDLSEGASISDINKEKSDSKIENNRDKIYISKNTIVYTVDNDLLPQVVLIESCKKNVITRKNSISIPKLKIVKSEIVSEPIKKCDFNIASDISNSISQMGFVIVKSTVLNANSHTKAVLSKNSYLHFNKTVFKMTVINFIKNGDGNKTDVDHFSIRPPPIT